MLRATNRREAAPVNQYKYWAFVSYSHHDVRVARRMKSELAKCRVPSRVRNTTKGSSPYFNDVFIDEHDAGADPSLRGELEEALQASRRLIVICSPFAAHSDYVSDEIRHFIHSGRSADILCVIASGSPDAIKSGQPQLNCFPSALLEARLVPMAPVLGSETDAEWRHTREQVAAGLAGCSLRDYQDSISRRRLAIALVAITGTALACVAAGVIAWAYYLPHISYAPDIVRRHGVWHPVGNVTQQVPGQEGYRFLRNGALTPPAEVRHVNAFGQCTGDLRSITGDRFSFQCNVAKACAVQFKYDGDLKEFIVDQFGKTVETVSYEGPGLALLTEAVISCSYRPSSIKFLRIERDDQGRDRRLIFQGGSEGTAVPNAEYAYGLQFEYTDAGQISRRMLIDKSHKPMNGLYGYAATTYSYNERHQLLAETKLDTDGNPVSSTLGYARMRRTLSPDERTVESKYYAENEQPTYDIEGVYGRRVSLSGRNVKEELLGPNGDLASRGDGVAVSESLFDDRGRLRSERYFDIEGHPIAAREHGCAALEIRITDSKDNTWQEDRDCLDAYGQPTTDLVGVMRERQKFDSRGRVLEIAFFGTHGQPTYNNDSEKVFSPIHRFTNHFDEKGNRTGVRFFGTDGTLTSGDQLQSAGWDATFDARNFETTRIYIGLDGKPLDIVGGPINEFWPDIFGRTVRERQRDTDGKSLANSLGIMELRTAFDERGNKTDLRFTDEQGQLRNNFEGVAHVYNQYSGQGKVTLKRRFDEHGSPVPDDDGWYGWSMSYDRFGRLIFVERLDKDGSIAAGADGIAAIRHTYDPHGRAVALDYLGSTRSSVLNRNNVAGERYAYNKRGWLLSQRFVGVGGATATNTTGVAEFRYGYDDRGRAVEIATFNDSGQRTAPTDEDGIAIKRFTLDDRGRRIREEFFGVDEKPHANRDGVFGYAKVLDSRGRELESIALGPEGKPLDSAEIIPVQLNTYDIEGRVIQRQNLDAHRQPMAQSPAQTHFEYDRFSRVRKWWFADMSGKPIVHPRSGRAAVEFSYDDFGRETEQRSLGLDGHLVNRSDLGWAVLKKTYDASTLPKTTICLDVKQQPVEPCKVDD